MAFTFTWQENQLFLFKPNQVMQSNRIINIAVFDNCFYISDVADILQRIAIYYYKIGPFTWFNRSGKFLYAHNFCRHYSG